MSTAHPQPQPPNAGRSKATTWLLLLATLLVALPPLTIDLSTPQVIDPREARTIATSLHTFDHADVKGWSDLGMDRFVPHFNGQQRLAEAPGVTWLHLAVFHLWPGDRPTGSQAICAARIVSVVFALLCVAATFWAGFSLGGLSAGFLAGLLCAANPLLIYHGRIATSEIVFIAMVTISVAAALWAIRPLRSAPTVYRQIIGWTTCGFAASAALLVVGPGAALIIVLPILAIVLVAPGRASHLLGLLAATCIAALTLVPWVVFAHDMNPDIWRLWAQDWVITTYWVDIGPAQIAPIAGARLLILLAAVLPWTLWLMAAVVQPFSASSGGARLRLFVGWGWFVAVLALFLAAPEVGAIAYLMVGLPATAIMVGVLFARFDELAADGHYPRLWRTLCWPQNVLLVAMSLAILAVMVAQKSLVQRGLLPEPLLAQPGWLYVTASAAALLIMAAAASRYVAFNRPVAAAACWAGWTLVAMTLLAVPLARGPLASSDVQTEAARIAALTESAPAFWLHPEVGTEQADAAVLLYADRILPPVKRSQLARVTQQHPAFYLVTSIDAAPVRGARLVEDLPATGLRLWHVRR